MRSSSGSSPSWRRRDQASCEPSGQRLPGRLSVGRGNALSLAGTCHAGTERIESLSVVANGVEAEVRSRTGCRRRAARDRAGTRWWGIVPIPAGTSELDASESGFAPSSATAATLAPSWARSSWSHAPSTRPARRTATAARPRATAATGTERGTRRAGPVIAIAMATHRPPTGAVQAADRVDPRADARELGLRDQRRRLRRSSASRRCVRSSATTRASACMRRRAARRLPQLRARARAGRPPKPSSSRSATRTTTGTRTSSQTLREALGGGPSSPTATCASSRANGEEISDTYWTERRNNHTNFASLLIANTVTGAASMFRREVLDYALPFPQELPEQRHDHWLAIVAMARGDIAYVPRPLYDYVQHADAALGHTRGQPGRRLEHARRAHGDDEEGRASSMAGASCTSSTTAGWCSPPPCSSLRFCDQLAKDRRKAIDRVLGSDSLRGMAWLRRTRRPGPVRWGHRDDAARQQPRTLDRLASHHAVTCPASRRAGPGRSGRRGAARPPAGRRRPPRSRAGGSGRRALQVVPRPGAWRTRR